MIFSYIPFSVSNPSFFRGSSSWLGLGTTVYFGFSIFGKGFSLKIIVSYFFWGDFSTFIFLIRALGFVNLSTISSVDGLNFFLLLLLSFSLTDKGGLLLFKLWSFFYQSDIYKFSFSIFPSDIDSEELYDGYSSFLFGIYTLIY